jgi:hypothetical protein
MASFPPPVTVLEELHKAGWRLADLLERALDPGSTTPEKALP